MGQFLGFVALEGNALATVLTEDANRVPKDADAAPTFRVYGPAGLMTGGTGTATLKDTGTVTGATNASPIEVTSANHGLNTGTRVTVASVGGNTAANGTATVTRTGANTFTLDGTTGNSAYTSGGSWHVSGLYTLTIAALAASGYDAGLTYTVLVSFAVGGTSYGELQTFAVV